jgi:hypothetical protein
MTSSLDRGRALYAKRDFAAAQAQFERAAQSERGARALNNVTACLFERGRYAECVEHCALALQLLHRMLHGADADKAAALLALCGRDPLASTAAGWHMDDESAADATALLSSCLPRLRKAALWSRQFELVAALDAGDAASAVPERAGRFALAATALAAPEMRPHFKVHNESFFSGHDSPGSVFEQLTCDVSDERVVSGAALSTAFFASHDELRAALCGASDPRHVLRTIACAPPKKRLTLTVNDIVPETVVRDLLLLSLVLHGETALQLSRAAWADAVLDLWGNNVVEIAQVDGVLLPLCDRLVAALQSADAWRAEALVQWMAFPDDTFRQQALACVEAWAAFWRRPVPADVCTRVLAASLAAFNQGRLFAPPGQFLPPLEQRLFLAGLRFDCLDFADFEAVATRAATAMLQEMCRPHTPRASAIKFLEPNASPKVLQRQQAASKENFKAWVRSTRVFQAMNGTLDVGDGRGRRARLQKTEMIFALPASHGEIKFLKRHGFIRPPSVRDGDTRALPELLPQLALNCTRFNNGLVSGQVRAPPNAPWTLGITQGLAVLGDATVEWEWLIDRPIRENVAEQLVALRAACLARGAVVLEFSGDDMAALLRSARRRFHVVTSSNVVDYVNVLRFCLDARDALAADGSCLCESLQAAPSFEPHGGAGETFVGNYVFAYVRVRDLSLLPAFFGMAVASDPTKDKFVLRHAEAPSILPLAEQLHEWMLELINLVLLPVRRSEPLHHFTAVTAVSLARLFLQRLPALGWAPHTIMAAVQSIWARDKLIAVRQGVAESPFDRADPAAAKVPRPLAVVALDLATAFGVVGTEWPVDAGDLGRSAVRIVSPAPADVDDDTASVEFCPVGGLLLVPKRLAASSVVVPKLVASEWRHVHLLSIVALKFAAAPAPKPVVHAWITREWFDANKSDFVAFLVATDTWLVAAELGPLDSWRIAHD